MNEASMELIQEKVNLKTKIKVKLYFFLKRTFDVIMSLISMILLSPLMLIIGILIRLDSKGKVVFTQERIGKNGQPIRVYKFRSMIPNAEEELKKMLNENDELRKEYKKNKKLENDPRITKLGNFLRKSSLDELPQLLNILKGDMSFVGPRPYLYREKEDMEPYYKNIIKMKPGLTGLWQVSGRSNLGFNERIQLDNRYYRTRGIKTDIKLILKTFKVVLKKQGAK